MTNQMLSTDQITEIGPYVLSDLPSNISTIIRAVSSVSRQKSDPVLNYTRRRHIPWYLYKMVYKNRLRTYEVKRSFREEEKNRI